jgi:membrane-associated protease RseP (regulator of RpoE activity)
LKQDQQKYVVIIAVGVLAVLLSTCLGALAGGTFGYWAGRRSVTRSLSSSSLPEWERVPVQPEETEPTPLPSQAVGALVTEVVKDTPAAQAGIEAGDLIVAVDGVTVDRERVLERIIRSHQPGDRVEITLWRGGRERTVSVKLAQNPEDSEVGYLGVYYEIQP